MRVIALIDDATVIRSMCAVRGRFKHRIAARRQDLPTSRTD